jgi:large subunit ribosomal protein L10
MLSQSQGLILTEFRGATDKQLKDVRKVVREANGAYRITKTRLLIRAMESAGYPIPAELKGTPLAVGFCFGDVPAVAKALSDFAKDSEVVRIRGGLMGQSFIGPEEVKAIASLPPLEVLQSQLLGLLDAPASSLVGVLQAGMSQVVNVISAYADKEQGAAA